jgi:hypothetical protein
MHPSNSRPAVTDNPRAQNPLRTDWHTARFVREGILVQRSLGTRHAARFLKDRLVDIDVALRVLLQPGMRRDYDRA